MTAKSDYALPDYLPGRARREVCSDFTRGEVPTGISVGVVLYVSQFSVPSRSSRRGGEVRPHQDVGNKSHLVFQTCTRAER